MNVNDLKQKGYRIKVIHFRRYATVNPDGLRVRRDLKDYTLDISNDGERQLTPIHCENSWITSFNPNDMLPRGGQTRVIITKSGDHDSGTTAIATAKCSLSDNYCKKEGVRIALERAVEALENVDE